MYLVVLSKTRYIFENDNAMQFIREAIVSEKKELRRVYLWKIIAGYRWKRSEYSRPLIQPNSVFHGNTVTFSGIDKSTGMDRFRWRRDADVIRQKAIDHAPVKTYASCHVFRDTRLWTNIDARGLKALDQRRLKRSRAFGIQ